MHYYKFNYPAVYKVIKMSSTFNSCNIKVMNTLMQSTLMLIRLYYYLSRSLNAGPLVVVVYFQCVISSFT